MESSMSQDNGLLLLHKCWGIKCEAFTVNKCWNKAKRFLSKLWGFHNVSNYVWQDVISVCLRHFMEHEVKDMNWSALSALQHLNASLNVLNKTFQYVGLLSHIFTHHKITLFSKSIILGPHLDKAPTNLNELAVRSWQRFGRTFSCVRVKVYHILLKTTVPSLSPAMYGIPLREPVLFL